MKFLLIIIIFFIGIISVQATVCDFGGYEIKENNVYGITNCDNVHSDIIPFADYSSFIINKDNKNIANDDNYNYNQTFVVSQVNGSEFVEINKYIFTDKKNVFILSQGLYLYIGQYDNNITIFPIYEGDDSGRYLLKIGNKLLNIKISNGYTSYNGSIHEITNIDSIENFQKINEYIYTDNINFYIGLLKNESNIGMNFGFDLSTVELFSSNNKQFFSIYKLGKRMNQLDFSSTNTTKIQGIYNKLKLIQNPYIYEENNEKYGEFFIKKELLLYFLGNILKK